MQYITQSIDIPADILNQLTPYDEAKLLAIASSLARNYDVPRSAEIAGRIYMYVKLKGCPQSIEAYTEALSHRLRHDIIKFLLQHKLRLNDILKIRQHLNYICFDYFSAVKLCGSYLLPQGPNRPNVESPQLLYLRVATELYMNMGIDKVIEKYLEMSNLYYTHASPCLFNAGTKNPQMSSCFLITIGDNLESIVYRGLGDSAVISKNMGGLGINLTKIRHSIIGYSGESSGCMSFAQAYDRLITSVNQGGRRNGAVTLFLRDWHIDVLEFIRACASIGSASCRFENATGCIWTSNLFFERVRNNGHWTLFCPSHVDDLADLYNDDFERKYQYFEKLAEERLQIHLNMKKDLENLRMCYDQDPDSVELRQNYFSLGHAEVEYERKSLIKFKKISARQMYQEIVKNQIRRSVYIMNGDKINATCNMSNIGPVNGSNLCLEIIEPSSENEIASCNLASINLKAFCRGKIDWRKKIHTYDDLAKVYDFNKLADVARSCVENLNRVIDLGNYPLDKHTESVDIHGPISQPNKRNRPMGIGVSGLNDAYLNCDIIYTSETAKLLNKMIFSTLYYSTLSCGVKMAIEDGEYSSFRSGDCKVYINNKWTQISGSPLSNGYFQFDLWKQYADYQKSKDRLITVSRDNSTEDCFNEDSDYDIYGILPGETLYQEEDDEPLDPSLFGVKPFKFSTFNTAGFELSLEINSTWNSLREFVIRYGVRNSMYLALMPTASTADILRNTESTEAHQQLVYTRSVNNGNIVVVVPQLRNDLEELKIWSSDIVHFINACGGSIKYIHMYVKDHFPEFQEWDRLTYLQSKHKSMFEISQKDILLQARQRGIYIDQSQSLNLYIAKPQDDILMKMHQYSTALGIKTNIYYLRQAPDIDTKKLNLPHHIRKYYEMIVKSNEDIEESTNEEQSMYCTMEEGCVYCQS